MAERAAEADEDPGLLSDDDLREFDTKARQCQPPHFASTWELIPPVNEWYAADVPRLVEEVRRLRALVGRLDRRSKAR
jgi:hypothetical protein